MTYHAIGMEEWNALPKLFPNSGLASNLTTNMKWLSWTNMLPHKFYPGTMCLMDYGVSFNMSTQMFTKYVQLKEIKYGQ
jgi:hypothetical protein